MNYLIKLLKSCFAVLNWRTVELACRSEEGVFYAFPGGCQPLCLAGEASDETCANFLTNQGFYTLFTAGNARRPRQRMRTLRPHYQDSKEKKLLRIKKRQKALLLPQTTDQNA